MAAFKKLDDEEGGVLEMELMDNYITQMGIDFNVDEVEKFKAFILGSKKDKETFHYEDYVADWKTFVDKHKYNFLEKDFEKFDESKIKKNKGKKK